MSNPLSPPAYNYEPPIPTADIVGKDQEEQGKLITPEAAELLIAQGEKDKKLIRDLYLRKLARTNLAQEWIDNHKEETYQR
jgi:hypothetical protein